MKHFFTRKIAFIALMVMYLAQCQNLRLQGTAEIPSKRGHFDEFRQRYDKKYMDPSEELYRSLIIERN